MEERLGMLGVVAHPRPVHPRVVFDDADGAVEKVIAVADLIQVDPTQP